MQIDRRGFVAGAAALGATTVLPGCKPAASGDTAAMTLLDRHAEALLASYPENAAFLGIDTGKRAALKSTLSDHSIAGEARRKAEAAKRLDELRAIDLKRLSPHVTTHVETATVAHEIALDGWRRMPVGDMAFLSANGYRSTPYIVSQGNGAFVDVPDLLENKHQIASAADADAYLARMRAYAQEVRDETERVKADAARGVYLPGFLNDITARQLRDGAAKPAEWAIVTTLDAKARAANVPGEWTARAAQIAEREIAPALAAQADAFAALRSKAPDVAGMWQVPDADNIYGWLAEAGTTTRRSPEEIHAAGLEQCKALAAEMDPLLRAQGLTQGTAGERLIELGKRPDLLFANTDAGRAELLAYLNSVVTKIRPLMPKAFGKLVRGNLNIKRVPPAIQDGAPNGYAGAGSMDGKIPGTYYVNLRDTGIWPRFSLPTLTFHEGIPGHIWQGEYTFDLPLIRTLLSFNAYSEGWGLYAEQIADEVGFYHDDPLGRIGYLQSMNFRAARLVADTGLHHKRWTMDKAMEWFMATTGFTASQARSELNRYCTWPGQALGYKTGHNEINRLRDVARAKIGSRFDVRGFNDAVVQTGGVPLEVLTKVVDRWAGA